MVNVTDPKHRSLKKRLRESLPAIREAGLTEEAAIQLLRICAVLQDSNELPFEVGYDEIGRLVEIALDKELRAGGTIEQAFGKRAAAHRVRLARGLDVGLTEDQKLASIALRVDKFEEGKLAMAIAGIGHDVASDVAERHDDYLVEAYRDAEQP